MQVGRGGGGRPRGSACWPHLSPSMPGISEIGPEPPTSPVPPPPPSAPLSPVPPPPSAPPSTLSESLGGLLAMMAQVNAMTDRVVQLSKAVRATQITAVLFATTTAVAFGILAVVKWRR